MIQTKIEPPRLITSCSQCRFFDEEMSKGFKAKPRCKYTSMKGRTLARRDRIEYASEIPYWCKLENVIDSHKEEK